MSANTVEEFSADELKAPVWLDEEFFRKVLKSHEGVEEVELKDFKLKTGVGKNDHYASSMFKFQVIYTKQGLEKIKHLIIKIMPETKGNKKDFLEKSQIFETEISMYRDLIPRFEKILQEAGDNTKLGVPFIYGSLKPRKVIILEDLSPQGYVCITDRQLGLDEVLMSFGKLAKLQAISYKLLKEEPELFEKYCHSLLSNRTLEDLPFFLDSMGNFIEMLDRFPKLQKYKKYFLSLEENILQKFTASFEEYFHKRRPNIPYVLCHGDFHSRNVLFKRNSSSGELEDVHLIDYQICHVNLLVADIKSGHINMANREVRENHSQEIDQHYLQTFNETLKKIGYQGQLISQELWYQLSEDFKEIELFYLCTFLPAWNGLSENKFDLEKLMTSAEFRKSLYQSASLAQQYEVLLPKYNIL